LPHGCVNGGKKLTCPYGYCTGEVKLKKVKTPGGKGRRRNSNGNGKRPRSIPIPTRAQKSWGAQKLRKKNGQRGGGKMLKHWAKEPQVLRHL